MPASTSSSYKSHTSVLLQADLAREVSAAAGNKAQGDASGKSLSQKLASGLRDFADRVDAQPELVSRAADLMSLDFMENRAPPPGQVGGCLCCTLLQILVRFRVKSPYTATLGYLEVRLELTPC